MRLRPATRAAEVLWLLACLGGCEAEESASTPPQEVDAGPECAAPRPCPDGCAGSMQACLDGRFGPCDRPAETCDATDQDCDGQVDEGVTQACTDACGEGISTCTDGAFGPCLGTLTPDLETCDGTDEDCDGQVDEPPILPQGGQLALPVGAPNFHALVWFGEILGVVAGGYPNWLVQLSLPGPTLWQVRRFGLLPEALEAVVVRRGVVIAWPEPTGPIQLGLMGEDGEFVRAFAPLPIERATVVRLAPAAERVALAWVERGDAGGRVRTALIDPLLGEVVHGPFEVGPGEQVQLVSNGEDGFGLVLQSADGIWSLVRLSGLAEPAFAPVVVGQADAIALNGNYYIEEIPVVFSQGNRLILQRFSRLGVALGEPVELAGQAATDLHLLRVDRTYGLFYVALGTVYAQVVGAGGRPLGPAQAVATDAATLRAVVAGLNYTLAWWDGAGISLLGGPLECPTF